jgi:hypothetical protein
MLALLLLACSKNGDSTAADDSGPADDSGEGIVYPDGDRILMYYGNGGFTTDIAGTGEFESIGKIWKKTYGWNTDSMDHWPADTIESYRLIALIAPGWTGISPFDDPTAALLQGALDRGTRVVVVAERERCKQTTETVNPLLATLGVSWTMNGGAGDPFTIEETNAVASGHQMTQNVSELRMIDPCWADKGSATVLAADDENNFISVAERPGKGGDVVFLGDITIMDDTENGEGDHGFEKADNLTFLDNMVRITWK